MLNSLDLLVIAFMVIASLSLLALLVMFLVKNKIVRRVSFGIVTAMTLYLSVMGIYIGLWGFAGQVLLGAISLIAAVGFILLTVIGAKKHNDKFELIARIGAAAALVISFINAIS